MRVGLSLAAGGVVGVSWEIGVLEAIRRVTGFSPADAELIVGTSAGAFVGAVTLSIGVPLTFAHCAAEAPPGVAFSSADYLLARRMDRHLHGTLLERFPLAGGRGLRPGSVSGIRRIARGEERGLAVDAASLLPEGLFSTHKIGDVIREVCPSGWSARTEKLRITVFDLNEARPRVLTARDDLGIGVADAVAASCAIPGMFAPLRVGARRLADGGIWSAAFLGEMRGLGLDAVICVHPVLGQAPPRSSVFWRAANVFDRRFRARVAAQFEREKRALEAEGTLVLAIAPDASEHELMPRNFMDLSARSAIMRRAMQTTERRLAADCKRLADVLTDAAGRAARAA